MAVDDQSPSFLEPDVLARLASVPLFARRPMQGNVSGRHRSLHQGSSVEFAQYRKYVPGDDLRRLHWRALARTGREYVKEFEADTNLRCCFVVDISGSMRFGSGYGGGLTKIDYARRLAGSLGYLAAQQGDAVGLTCVSDKVVTNIPARRNPAHLRHIIDTLAQVRPAGATRLVPILHELAETTRKRALVVVLSDLFVQPSELRECFEHLRFRNHDLAVFHLLDHQETQFDFKRPIRFVDLEGGPSVLADPSEIADLYHKALKAYLAALRQAVLETGVDYHGVQVDESYEKALMRFLVRRTQRTGGR